MGNTTRKKLRNKLPPAPVRPFSTTNGIRGIARHKDATDEQCREWERIHMEFLKCVLGEPTPQQVAKTDKMIEAYNRKYEEFNRKYGQPALDTL